MNNHEEFTREVIEALKNIAGIPLSYSKICEAVGLEKKRGKGKEFQLEHLKIICDLTITYKPTRYTIENVVDYEIVEKINISNKQQQIFDYGIYKALKENNGNPVALTRTNLLKEFGLVNQNFLFLREYNSVDGLDAKFANFAQIGKDIRPLLIQWVLRKIDNMDSRGIFDIKKSFRLYKLQYFGKNKKRSIYEVEYGTELYYRCLEIQQVTIAETFPIDEETGKKIYSQYLWNIFFKNLRKNIIEVFHGKYSEMRETYVFSAPSNINNFMEKMENVFGNKIDMTVLNQIAQRKILDTDCKQYLKYKDEIPYFVSVAIDTETDINLEEMSKKAQPPKIKTEETKKIPTKMVFDDGEIMKAMLLQYSKEHPEEFIKTFQKVLDK